MELTKQQEEQFWRDGYLHLPNFFHPKDMDAVIREYYRIFLPQLRISGILPSDIENTVSWYDLVTGIEKMRTDQLTLYDNCREQIQRAITAYKLALDVRIFGILQQLGMQSPTIHQRPALSADMAITHYQDQLWKLWKPSCNAVAAAVYLGNIHNSPEALLHLVPGSHVGGLRTMTDIATIHSHDSYTAIYPVQNRRIGGYYSGDLVLFSPLIVSRLPERPFDLPMLSWCYSDLDDTFYRHHGYQPSVSSPVADALLKFLQSRLK